MENYNNYQFSFINKDGEKEYFQVRTSKSALGDWIHYYLDNGYISVAVELI